jgi:hypothetical protein
MIPLFLTSQDTLPWNLSMLDHALQKDLDLAFDLAKLKSLLLQEPTTTSVQWVVIANKAWLVPSLWFDGFKYTYTSISCFI